MRENRNRWRMSKESKLIQAFYVLHTFLRIFSRYHRESYVSCNLFCELHTRHLLKSMDISSPAPGHSLSRLFGAYAHVRWNCVKLTTGDVIRNDTHTHV
jgi:hypothetical protein